ncbi:MAG TPA: zinc-dependent metalloprotease family protein [Flavobacteriaceae bacterium]
MTKLNYVLAITIFLNAFSLFGQKSSWAKIENINDQAQLAKLHLNKNKVQIFELNLSVFQQTLSAALLQGALKNRDQVIIQIPGYNGKLESFKIYEAPVFAPELSVKFPNIKSYAGFSLESQGARLRMSVSPQGVQTMISYIDRPTLFMQPISKGSNQYVQYGRSARGNYMDKFECRTIDAINKIFNKKGGTITSKEANDKLLRKYRLVVSTTGEYTQYHDDGNAGNGDAVVDALAAINATITRVNEVYEMDMAITFEIIGNDNLVVFDDPATDPYSDAANLDNWNLELQNTLTSVLGNAAYDIGHLFGASGGGGNAGCIGCVCEDDTPSPNDLNKGAGYTSPADGIPEGDNFDIDYVAHEIGHQMGANHTFAYVSEGTGVNSEPGSGTTIMAYAGITGPDDIQPHSDPYFHYHSIDQILDNVAISCAITTVIANDPPTANAGLDYSIPKGTPYVLKGDATDPNGGDALTYCWEQIDSGVANYLNFGPDLLSGSMNRSLSPSSSKDRYIPRFSSVLDGNVTQTNPTVGSDWETASNVARTLNWALTVRDRSASTISQDGQTSFDLMEITVEDVDPFTVTNPISWTQGSTQEITWHVGQTTDIGTINCQLVNIKLSTDGGLTFPVIIASDTPNDGSYMYPVSSGMPDTSTARLMVEAADNIFYDVSDFDFSISQDPDFFIIETSLDDIVCGDNSATFNLEYYVANGFSETTTFTASGNPGGTSVVFSPDNLSAPGPFTMTVNNLNSLAQGNYTITITGTPTSSSPKNKDVILPLTNGNCTSVANEIYETSTTRVQFNTIDNVSAKPSGYSDYTSISTNVNRDSSYNLTVNVNTDGDYTTNTIVWIDWNQNCSFDDAGEEYDLGSATNVANGTTSNSPSVTIPSSATLGSTIMRVTTKYDGDGLPTSCENGADGEVEDYTVNVLPTLDIETYGFDNFKVYPNPNKGVFVIKLNTSLSRDINIDIFDLRGRKIYHNYYREAGDFNENIKLNNVQSGLYLLHISDGVRMAIKKIVVE